MYDTVLLIAFVILALATAWAVYKAVSSLTRRDLGEGFGYLAAAAILLYLTAFLMISLPL